MDNTLSLNDLNAIFSTLLNIYIQSATKGIDSKQTTLILEEALASMNLSGKKFERRPDDNIYEFRKTMIKCTPYIHLFNTPLMGELYDEGMRFYEIVSQNR